MTDDLAALVNQLRSGSPATRQEAAQRLAGLEGEAQAAAVALVEAVATDDDQLREWVTAALENLGPPRADDDRQLAALVEQPSVDVAYWAATLLGRLEAAAAPAVPQLANALREHAQMAVRERAAWALGKIGPPALAAEQALAEAAASEHRRLARLAQEALANVKR